MPKAIAAVLLLCLMGCSENPIVGTGNPIGSTPEAEMVHEYLLTNPNDPIYEVVRFWPPIDSARAYTMLKTKMEATAESLRKLAEVGAGQPARIAMAQANVESARKILESSPDGKTVRTCRLKYQAKTEGGSLKMKDLIFMIDVPSRQVWSALESDEIMILQREFP